MNKITEKYTSTIDTTFILGNPLGEENPAKTSHKPPHLSPLVVS
jgi:hypothetical protein